VSTQIDITKTRFDDVLPDVSYHGFNYSVTIDEAIFSVRSYDDTPGQFTVISPASARKSPQAQQLVSYLVSELGCQRVQFYHGLSGTFRAVDLQTLEF
jgi:hypothetical protein